MDIEKLLEQNKQLIENYVQLAIGNVFDPRYDWFYQSISREEIASILHISSDEDIRNDIIVFIIEQAQNYSGKDFSKYLHFSIGLFVRDRLRVLLNQSRQLTTRVTSCSIDLYGSFDLRWTLSDKYLPLTDYERYILYLDLHKCYTINQICETVYQDRSTLRHVLRNAKQVLKEVYSE